MKKGRKGATAGGTSDPRAELFQSARFRSFATELDALAGRAQITNPADTIALLIALCATGIVDIARQMPGDEERRVTEMGIAAAKALADEIVFAMADRPEVLQ